MQHISDYHVLHKAVYSIRQMQQAQSIKPSCVWQSKPSHVWNALSSDLKQSHFLQKPCTYFFQTYLLVLSYCSLCYDHYIVWHFWAYVRALYYDDDDDGYDDCVQWLTMKSLNLLMTLTL